MKKYKELIENVGGDVINSDDIDDVLNFMGSHERMFFVWKNFGMLKKKGVFEYAFFRSYIETRINHNNMPFDCLEILFDSIEKEKFFLCGDPLPMDKGLYTVYRGISGNGKKRRKRGFSWTGDFDKAVWFAKRLRLEKPIVFKAIVPKEYVLAYCNRRKEDEYICKIPKNQKLVKVWP